MTSGTSASRTQVLLSRFRIEQDAWATAHGNDDVPRANRHVMKAWAPIQELAADPGEGRPALEALLTSDRADIRLRAAQAVIEWAPGKAIPVLGRLLFEDLGPDVPTGLRIEVRISATHALYDYFSIRSFDQNDLIKPLEAYGVKLPRRP